MLGLGRNLGLRHLRSRLANQHLRLLYSRVSSQRGHDEEGGEDSSVADPMPFAAFGLEELESSGDWFTSHASEGELSHEDWDGDDDGEKDVEEEERSSAVFTDDIGETPDVAQPHCGASGCGNGT